MKTAMLRSSGYAWISSKRTAPLLMPSLEPLLPLQYFMRLPVSRQVSSCLFHEKPCRNRSGSRSKVPRSSSKHRRLCSDVVAHTSTS